MHTLLFSNSTNAGSDYLAHAWDRIAEFCGDSRDILFVPFADPDPEDYLRAIEPHFAERGYRVTGLHSAEDPAAAIAAAEVIFTGGGNTFLLIGTLRKLGLIEPLREFSRRGGRYFGASAGSNIACPTIRTTNDMPIYDPLGFEALGLIPFQLNCHYLDPEPGSRHNGETRIVRIGELHQLSPVPVLGLREGAHLDATGGRYVVGGAAADDRFGPALWFEAGEEPREVSGDITELVAAALRRADSSR